MELPVQIVVFDSPLIVGSGFTVTTVDTEELQPSDVPVTVYVVDTVGVAVTVAPVEAERAVDGAHVYVVAPLAVIVPELPVQIVSPVAMFVVGIGLTVTVRVCVFTHELLLVPVTVYVVVTVGEAVTVVPVVADSPVEGFHV